MEELRVCPNCEYQRGFHVSFRRGTKAKVKIILICPNCGQSYDLGWTTAAVKSFKPEQGLKF